MNLINRMKIALMNAFQSTESGLTFKEKWKLALPGPALSVGGVLIHNVFIKYYTDIVGLEPAYVSLVYVVYNIWNAINDPIIGVLLDKMDFVPKRGKYVYIMRVTVPLMLFFSFLMILSSPTWDQWVIFLIYTVELFIYDTAETSYKIAYRSYQLIVAPTSAERVDVNIAVRYISQIMSFFMTAIPTLLLVGDGKRELIIPIFTIVILGEALFFFWALRGQRDDLEMYKSIERQHFPTHRIWKESLQIIKSRPFLAFTLFSILTSPIGFYYTPFLYYMDSVMQTSGIVATAIDTIATAVVLLALPFIARIAKKFGTKISVYLGTIPAVIGYGGYFLADNIWSAALSFLIVIFTVNYIETVIVPMSPLIIDEDERRTGVRKTGLYSGLFNIFTDALKSLQTVYFMTIISLFGYQAGADIQSDSAILGIRIATALVPLASLLIGLIPMAFYPFNKKKEDEISAFSDRARRKEDEENVI